MTKADDNCATYATKNAVWQKLFIRGQVGALFTFDSKTWRRVSSVLYNLQFDITARPIDNNIISKSNFLLQP